LKLYIDIPDRLWYHEINLISRSIDEEEYILSEAQRGEQGKQYMLAWCKLP